jgi:hypothetical protein
MTALLPILPGQVDVWSRPRPEPVALDIPGWDVVVTEPNEGRGYDVTYGVRVVFERCERDVIEDALARSEVRW